MLFWICVPQGGDHFDLSEVAGFSQVWINWFTSVLGQS